MVFVKIIKFNFYAADEKVGDPVELSADNQLDSYLWSVAEKKIWSSYQLPCGRSRCSEGYQVTADTSDAATIWPIRIRRWSIFSDQEFGMTKTIKMVFVQQNIVWTLANGEKLLKRTTNATDRCQLHRSTKIQGWKRNRLYSSEGSWIYDYNWSGRLYYYQYPCTW